MTVRQDQCELSIKKTGAVLGIVTVEWENFDAGGGMNDSSGQLQGITMAQAAPLMQSMQALILRRLSDNTTAEVTITDVLADDRAAILFDHAPFLPSSRTEGEQ